MGVCYDYNNMIHVRNSHIESRKRFKLLYNMHCKLILAVLFLIFIPASLYAYPRISLGGGISGISMQGMLAGSEYGTLESKATVPVIVIEGEVVPVYQWSIFMRVMMDPFNPDIRSGGMLQPADPNAKVPYTLAGRAAIGTGWQLPFDDWTRQDVPFDLTLGLGAVMDFMHLSFSTPQRNYSCLETSFGAGLYVAASAYFGPHFGISLSAMPSLTLMDNTSASSTATGGDSTRNDSLTFTSLKFSWDAVLAATIRFGW